MALESLPPDQRAVLQLVLARGRSYAELSAMLHISPEAVRARAQNGATALVPEGAEELDPEARARAVDYLLGQEGVSARRAARAELGRDLPLRSWTLSLAAALAPVTQHPLPEVPEPEAGAETEAAAPQPASTRASEAGGEIVPEADGEEPRRSLLGGALLLAGLVILVVVLIIALTHKDSKDSGRSSTAAADTRADTSTTSSTPTTTDAQSTQTLGQANLQPTQAGSQALAVAQLKVQGNSAGFEITAQGLTTAPNTYHGVWLEGTGTEKTQFLGAVLNADVKSGRFQRLAPVPSNVTAFNKMVISREPITSSKQAPKAPTSIILSGPLRLVGTG